MRKYFRNFVVVGITLFVFAITFTSVQAQDDSPYKYGRLGRFETPNVIISDFKAGLVKKVGGVNRVYKETRTIVRKRNAAVGVEFLYEIKAGKDNFLFTEEEIYPYPPSKWELDENIDGEADYKIFKEENKAILTLILDRSYYGYCSYWDFGKDLTKNPLGEWVWNISFDGEYYTTVIFDVVEP